jgi:phosphohistidine phosphatase
LKYLALLRHAKSSWKDPSLDDFDRSLNSRGKRDAPIMGQRLAMLGNVPEVIIASPAKRARMTAELVANAIHYPKAAIRYDPCIYDADADTLIELISRLDIIWQDVMLVGHNPGLTLLASQLASTRFDNIVTCGVAKFVFEADSWRDIKLNSGRLLFYDFPKKNH